MITIQNRYNETKAQFDFLSSGARYIEQDLFIQNLQSGIASFNFSMSKECEKSSEVKIGDYVLVSDEETQKLFEITYIEENHEFKHIHSEDAGLELIGQLVNLIESQISENLEFYFKKIVGETGWEIGINESNSKEILSWSDTETIVKRLKRLANAFNCELRYEIELRDGKVYRKLVHFEKRIGKDHKVRLEFGREVSSIKKTSSTYNLATALKAVGADGITLKNYTFDDGRYYIESDMLIDRQEAKRWSRFGADEVTPIVKIYESEAKTQERLLQETLRQLKKSAYPEVSYEVQIDDLPEILDIGDSVAIVDFDFKPALTLEARVTEIRRPLSDTSKGTAIITNFVDSQDTIDERVKLLSKQLSETLPTFATKEELDKKGGVSAEEVAKQVEVSKSEINSKIEEVHTVLAQKLTESDLKDLRGSYTDLEAGYSRIREIGTDLSSIGSRISAVELNQADSQTLLNFISTNFSFSEDGMLVGKNGSKLKLLQTNEKISFVDGGKEVAFLTGQKFSVLSAEFLESVVIGNHIFEKLENMTLINFAGSDE